MARKPKGFWTDALGITPSEDSLEYQRRWRDANPGSFKYWKYGITQEEYLNLLDKQDSKCAICRTDSPGGRHNNWHIDHDHSDNEVRIRGLLCWLCNSGLGKFHDDIRMLENAIAYLKGNKSEL